MQIPSAPPHLSNSYYHHNHQCQRNNANLYCRNGVIPPPLRGRGNVELALTRSSDLLSAHHHRGFADTTGGVMVPSIQTVGDRRFYVLPPENRINVIEAPPTYDDALKHPAVNLETYVLNFRFQSRLIFIWRRSKITPEIQLFVLQNIFINIFASSYSCLSVRNDDMHVYPGILKIETLQNGFIFWFLL